MIAHDFSIYFLTIWHSYIYTFGYLNISGAPNELRIDAAEGIKAEAGFRVPPHQSELSEAGQGRPRALDLEIKARHSS
jgi:hypothetical protein